MIKILHSADWHLDSALLSRSDDLRKALARVPEQVISVCKAQNCELLLLSGDLFDGPYSADAVRNLRDLLEEVKIPVFISPGNHDYVGPDSPWLTVAWPENVHIFIHPVMESVVLPELDCTIYGAGYVSMDCNGLLADFTPDHTTRYGIGVLHGDPTQVNSPYCPVTAEQVRQSELDYLALGHIHKGDQFRSGKTLCAWPGCPMGRGFDETGDKGVLLVTLDETAEAVFIPLNTPRFYDLEAMAGTPLATLLPPVGNNDHYRITFTGTSEPLDLEALKAPFGHFPNLQLRDRTSPIVDVWGSAGDDTLEGMYFKLLHDTMETADSNKKRQIQLAAEISRQILDGQEVVLP